MRAANGTVDQPRIEKETARINKRPDDVPLAYARGPISSSCGLIHFTITQVVIWPALEPVLGPRGNFVPFLTNTVTTGVVVHLYGPLFWQIVPVLPLAVTAVCVCV